MSYISRDNLSNELIGKLDKLDNIEAIVEDINSEISSVQYIETSHEILIQNEDYSFNPPSFLITNSIGNTPSTKKPSPTQFQVYYSLRNQRGRWWEYNQITIVPPSSIMINLNDFPTSDLEDVQYIRIDTVEDGKIINTKQIPVVKNGQKGQKGEGFTFDDLTESQRELIRGYKGDTGDKGEKGEVGDINIIHYSSQGETPYKLKMFTGETTIVGDGAWSINYSHVGFTKVLGVYPVAVHLGGTAGETPAGCIVSTYNTTTATGKSLKGTAVGLLVGMSLTYSNANETKVSVLVVGY